MEIWNTLSGHRLTEALGLTLMHSLWQGAAVALLLAGTLLLMRKRQANIRYVAVLGAHALWLAGALLTLGISFEQANDGASATAIADAQAMAFLLQQPIQAEPSQLHWLAQLPEYFRQHSPLIVTIWLMGMFMLAIKLLGGYILAQRMRNYRTRPVAPRWQAHVDMLASRLGIQQHIRLLESGMAKSPVTLGHFKPVVLMPLGILAGLPAEQIEAILAHELAHIKRNDYLVNLMQSLVEILFFYHPAIWWMGNLLREEREHACDDLAIEATGNRVVFAKALATIETGQFAMPSVAMAMAGRKGQLLGRIQRILGMGSHNRPLPEKMIVASLLILALFSTGFGKKEQLKEMVTEVAAEGWEMGFLASNDTTKQKRKDKKAKKEEKIEEKHVYVFDSEAPVIWHSNDSTGKLWHFSTADAPLAPMHFEFQDLDSLAQKIDSIVNMGQAGMHWTMRVAPNIEYRTSKRKRKDGGWEIEVEVEAPDAPDAPGMLWIADDTLKKGKKVIVIDREMSEADRKELEKEMEELSKRMEKLSEKQRELAEERMKIIQERQIIVQKRQEAMQHERAKEMAQRQEEQSKRAAERAEEAKKRAEELRAKIEEKTKAYQAELAQLRESLVADGLLESKDSKLKLYIDKEELRVNGKTASPELHQKYLKRFAKYEGRTYIVGEEDQRLIIDMK